MNRKIHILGASGVGTSTLGDSLSKVIPHRYLDTDDYFWITKFSEQRSVPARREMLENEKVGTKGIPAIWKRNCCWGQ